MGIRGLGKTEQRSPRKAGDQIQKVQAFQWEKEAKGNQLPAE